MYPYTRGRHRVLDEKKKDELCQHICSGATVEEAAHTVNVSLRTVQREMKIDEDFDHAVKLALREPPDPEKLMRAAARSHWRAAAWLLERAEPDKYAKRHAHSATPHQVEGAMRYVIEAALRATPSDQHEAIYAQLHAAVEAAMRGVFPDRGPWGDRRYPKLPPTPLANQAEDAYRSHPSRQKNIDGYKPDVTRQHAAPPAAPHPESVRTAPAGRRPYSPAAQHFLDARAARLSGQSPSVKTDGHATEACAGAASAPGVAASTQSTLETAALEPCPTDVVDAAAPEPLLDAETRAKLLAPIKAHVERWYASRLAAGCAPFSSPAAAPTRRPSRSSPILSPKTRITTKLKRNDKSKRRQGVSLFLERRALT